jgi:hypothetical protein
MHVMGSVLCYVIEHNTTVTLVLSARSSSLNRCHNGCECILAPISNCRFNDSNERMHVLDVHNRGIPEAPKIDQKKSIFG